MPAIFRDGELYGSAQLPIGDSLMTQLLAAMSHPYRKSVELQLLYDLWHAQA